MKRNHTRTRKRAKPPTAPIRQATEQEISRFESEGGPADPAELEAAKSPKPDR